MHCDFGAYLILCEKSTFRHWGYVSQEEITISANERRTILCIDDDPRSLELTTILLERAGHTVLTATRGESVIKIIQSTHVDLVLTDYKMVGMTGTQVAKMIKEFNPGILVAVFTGWEGMPEGAEHVDMFIPKTGNPMQMPVKLAALFEGGFSSVSGSDKTTY